MKEKDDKIKELEKKVFSQNDEIFEYKKKDQQLELDKTHEYEELVSSKENYKENQRVLGTIIRDFF